MQWNNKGDRFSMPKPTAGAAGARGAANTKGGGKGGWGSDLLLAEDQKEYVKAVKEEEREMRKTMKGVDEDLVGLFGGGGGRSGGRVKVGAGRDVNSKKRR